MEPQNRIRLRSVIERARHRNNRAGGPSLRILRPAIPVVLALGSLGCGTETAPGLGADSAPTTLATTTSSTVAAETTTTIDFNRLVTQQQTLLPDDATIAEFAELVNDMRGQSNQVAAQMARLVEFENLPSPAGAQILDFSISVTPLPEDEHAVVSVVDFRVPQDSTAVTTFLEEELRALGWNKASQSVRALSDGDETVVVFRLPGIPGELQELTATVGDIPGATAVSYDYRARLHEEGEATFLRFQAWQGVLRLPRSAQAISSSIRTADDIATMTVVHALEAETAAEARQDVVDLVDENELHIISERESGTTVAPLLLEDELGNELMIEFAPGGDEDTVEMTVIHTFDLDPLD